MSTLRQIAKITVSLVVLAVAVMVLWEMSVAGGSQAAPSQAPAVTTLVVPSGVSEGGNVPGPFVVGESEGGNAR